MSSKNNLETVIDSLPQAMEDLFKGELDVNEEIKAVVSGRTGEAVIVTDKRVFTINEGKIIQPFAKEEITGVKLSRRNRVGRFELFVKEPEKYTAQRKEDDCVFAPDLSKNVVNFPYSKFPMFTAVEKHINNLIEK